MRIRPSLLVSLVLLPGFLCLAGHATAFPNFGQACSTCHAPESGRLEVRGESGTQSLPGRLDGGTADPLKLFTVKPGDTVTLTLEVVRGGAAFLPMVLGLEAGAVAGDASHLLSLVADPNWTQPANGGTVPFLAPAGGTVTGTGTTQTFQFLLSVAAETPTDTYALRLAVAGRDGDPERTRWSQTEEVYVRVAAVPEPASFALFAIGLVAMLAGTRHAYGPRPLRA